MMLKSSVDGFHQAELLSIKNGIIKMIDPMIWFTGKNAKSRFYLALIILFVASIVKTIFWLFEAN